MRGALRRADRRGSATGRPHATEISKENKNEQVDDRHHNDDCCRSGNVGTRRDDVLRGECVCDD